MFVSHPKPDPVGDYINNHAKPYIDGLDDRPQPQLTYNITTSVSKDAASATVEIEITQPVNLSPAPEIGQILLKIYSGSRDTDLFLPPVLDENLKVVSNDIVWTVVDSTNFSVQGGNNADPNAHSIIGKLYPTVPATTVKGIDGKPDTRDPGTSVLGNSKLVLRIQGTPNKVAGTMAGTITEVLTNAPPDVMGTDVVKSFNVVKT
jgi:hypothetical protein